MVLFPSGTTIGGLFTHLFVNTRGMKRGCGCGGCLSKVVIAVAIVIIAVYWGYSSLTLEKLGKADEVGMFGFLGERYEDKSPRDLGIENLTLKEIIEWFFDDEDETAP